MKIRKLLWDKKIVDKIKAKHQVFPYEVKEVCVKKELVVRGREEKYYVLGQTKAGRYLFVVLAKKENAHYKVITAREMNDSEKKRLRKRRKS
ncbi:MAG: BrnT family toxin [bacterium]|nr:BrnT family toxin [bacterium]